MTETKGVDRSVLPGDPGAWRLHLAHLHRDAGGNPEWFMFAWAVKSALPDGGYPDSSQTRHRSRRAEPFLRGWQGAMNHWASYNGEGLKKSLFCHSRGLDRVSGWRPTGDRVLVAPASPARPAPSLPVLRRLGLSRDLHWSPLPTL